MLDRPAYSGLKERQYPRDDLNIEIIQVKTEPLDDLLPPDLKIDLIKVDVEGGELAVFRGALRTIRDWKPFIVFEHGLGAAEYYGTGPEMIYDLLADDGGLHISLLHDWLKGRPPLTRDRFVGQFHARTHFYFLAHP